jgi:hypothetical protein
MGVMDRDDSLVAARLVIAFGRPAHRLAGLLVGKLDLFPV